jgi:hypothetical protein
VDTDFLRIIVSEGSEKVLFNVQTQFVTRHAFEESLNDLQWRSKNLLQSIHLHFCFAALFRLQLFFFFVCPFLAGKVVPQSPAKGERLCVKPFTFSDFEVAPGKKKTKKNRKKPTKETLLSTFDGSHRRHCCSPPLCVGPRLKKKKRKSNNTHYKLLFHTPPLFSCATRRSVATRQKKKKNHISFLFFLFLFSVVSFDFCPQRNFFSQCVFVCTAVTGQYVFSQLTPATGSGRFSVLWPQADPAVFLFVSFFSLFLFLRSTPY